MSFSASRSCRERREDRCSCQASCCTQRLLLGGAAVASDLLHLEQPDLQMRNIQRECGIARPRLTESSATVSQEQMPHCAQGKCRRRAVCTRCGAAGAASSALWATAARSHSAHPTNKPHPQAVDSCTPTARQQLRLEPVVLRFQPTELQAAERTHSPFASPHSFVIRFAALSPCAASCSRCAMPTESTDPLQSTLRGASAPCRCMRACRWSCRWRRRARACRTSRSG